MVPPREVPEVDTQQGPAAEFAELLRTHQSRLFGYIHSLVRDLNDADELFQQTAVILWSKLDGFDRSKSFLSWLYAGAAADRNIRGGLISRQSADRYSQFLVNNRGGRDTDLHQIGLSSPGDELRLTLRRPAGRYTLTAENLTTGGSSTLNIRHPAFLDGERELYVGLFGATPQSGAPGTLVIQEFRVTVRTTRPAAADR